jgi:cellobiose phosphorylase
MTRRPWQIYLVSECVLTQINQFGHGVCRYWNERGEDVLLFDAPERTLAVRKPDGTVWSPAVFPDREVPAGYRCTYSPSTWTVEGADDQVRVSWRIAVPLARPVEMWTVTAENLSDVAVSRDLFVYLPLQLRGYCLGSLGLYRFYDSNLMFNRAYQQSEQNAIWADSRLPGLPHDRYKAFLACDVPPTSTDSAREAFLGISDSVFVADAIRCGRCSNSIGYFGSLCLAMHHHVELPPRASRQLNFLIGPTSGPEETAAICRDLLSSAAIEREIAQVVAARRQQRRSVEIHSDIPSLDRLANTWIKCQNRLGVLHRKGFRDVLQDSAGMTVYDSKRAEAGLEEAISVQRFDGAGIRAWKPGAPDKQEYSDGAYWLTLATVAHLRQTGDLAFLDRELPYFDDPCREPVWEHLLKGVRYLYEDRNERGLCRIRFADWNDALDGVGRKGKGDSTMVTFSLVAALRELQTLAALTKRELPFDAITWINEIDVAVHRHAWTGEYYIRGYRDDGQPYGSPQNRTGQIHLNPQTWAVLSEVAPRERWQRLLEHTIGRLGTPYGLRLLTPPYEEFDPYLGRISVELAGTYENGAAYNHASAFFMHALLKAGLTDRAWEYCEKILPDSEANPSDRSGAEPFVLTNCIFTGEAGHRAGTSYFGWYTGTAAWLIRLIHNGFSGLWPEYDGLHVVPAHIPSRIGLRSVSREFRKTRYEVEYRQGSCEELRIDGRATPLKKALPVSPGKTVRVEIVLPKTAKGKRR